MPPYKSKNIKKLDENWKYKKLDQKWNFEKVRWINLKNLKIYRNQLEKWYRSIYKIWKNIRINVKILKHINTTLQFWKIIILRFIFYMKMIKSDLVD